MTDNTAAVPAFTLRRHHAAVSAVEFNQDATLMASADQNGHAVIWSTATFRPVRAWNAHPGRQILRVSLLNNTTLLTFGRGDALNVWDLTSDRQVATAGAAKGALDEAVTTAPPLVAQMQVLSGGLCGGDVIPISSDTTGESHFLVALPSADENGKFDVFLLRLGSSTDTSKGRFAPVARHCGHDPSRPTSFGMLLSLRWFHRTDPSLVAPWCILAGYECGTVVTWGWRRNSDEAPRVRPPGHGPEPLAHVTVAAAGIPVTCAVPDRKAKVGVAGTASGTIYFFELVPQDTSSVIVSPLNLPAAAGSTDDGQTGVHGLVFRADNKRVAVASWSSGVHILSRNGKHLTTLPCTVEGAAAVAFSPLLTDTAATTTAAPPASPWTLSARQLLAAGTADGAVLLWRVR
ncbi:ASTRA complex subunit [Allomyces javanicus]|nr:ASTRA complex subunit [Allomyces javanicus]